jgi:hypothetical protein
MQFESSDRFTIPSTVRASVLDDEIVLLDLRAGEYFSLNTSGALVWRVIQEGGDVAAVERAAEQWPLPAAERTAVILSLIHDLVARGLLLHQSEPPAS